MRQARQGSREGPTEAGGEYTPAHEGARGGGRRSGRGRRAPVPPRQAVHLPGARAAARVGAAGLELLRWVAARYAGSLADVLRLAVPPRVAAVERDPGVAEALASGAAASSDQPGPTRSHASYWRPLPGEDRATRVVALVEAALAKGRGAIVVTPELAAGSAVADAVRKSFPDAADLSSDLSERRRYRAR